MSSIRIKYTSPAVPQYPYDVKLNTTYICEKKKDKYIVKGANFQRAFSFDFIKNMFTPIDEYGWDMLNPTQINTKDKANNIKE
jgi:hypothetical protein